MPHLPHNSAVWNAQLLADPHAAADKPARVRRMFAAIAGSYDLNNRLHSLWMDQYWRRRAVQMACLRGGESVLDVACGTGDLALRFTTALGRLGSAGRVIGLDFTYEMLPLARRKGHKAGVPVEWINGDAMELPLPEASVDVVSIAFGIRNVADPQRALAEFHRVLRPGGRVIVLEFSLPRNALLRGLYNFYFRRILPVTATLIAGDRTGAYKYLPQSVNTFIGREEMLVMMREAGFEQTTAAALTFGVCVCYRGVAAKSDRF
jgi:demethylmenaquinone methyltransferase / 2-methoxy-6-polyprenyl-1,4-benzoquinol methylase